jgi:hypothetical protein
MPRLLPGLVLGLALAALAGCALNPVAGTMGQVLVVDSRGRPLAGAEVLPDFENPTPRSRYQDEDQMKAGRVNDQGLVTVHLEDFYWSDDNCYHFRVIRGGYVTGVLTVSRDLYPQAPLRVELKAVGEP